MGFRKSTGPTFGKNFDFKIRRSHGKNPMNAESISR